MNVKILLLFCYLPLKSGMDICEEYFKAASSDEEACLDLANKLIVDCRLAHPRVSTMSALSSDLFCQLFAAICGVPVPGLLVNPQSEADESLRIQSIIDALSQDVVQLSLSHISGRRVASKDPRSVLDLLQVLEAWHNLREEESQRHSSLSSASVTTCGSSGWTGSTGGPSSSESHGWSEEPSSSPCFVCEFVKSRTCRADRHESEGAAHKEPSQVPSLTSPDWGSPIPTASLPKLWERKEPRRLPQGARATGHRYELRDLSPAVLPGENLLPDPYAPFSEMVQSARVSDEETVVRKRPKVIRKSVLLPPSPRRSKRRRTRSNRGKNDTDGRPEEDQPALPCTEDVLSPHAERILHRLQGQHASLAAQHCAGHVGTSVAQLNKKHAQLLNQHSHHLERLQKELGHAQRRNYLEAQRNVHHAVQSLQAERRQLMAKIRRRREEHDRVVRARRDRQRHAHQQMLYEAFRESLRTRRADLQEVRNMARERKVREEDRHRVQLASLENFYGSQLSLLSEALAKEKAELRQRAQAQSKVLEKMKREFRDKLEHETKNLYQQFADGNRAAPPSRKRVGLV